MEPSHDQHSDAEHAEAVRRYWTIPDEVEDPAWAARRRLAAAVRALTEAAIVSEGSAAELNAAAEAVEALASALPTGRRARQAFVDGHYFAHPIEYTDRSMLMGLSNPVAPPLHPVFDEALGQSSAVVVLGERFVGAPGMVHGGMVAACFDQICGHRLAMSGRGGFTIRLDVRYRRPVPVHTEVRFRCTLAQELDELVLLDAACELNGRVLAECQATFRLLRAEQARAVIGRAGR